MVQRGEKVRGRVQHLLMGPLPTQGCTGTSSALDSKPGRRLGVPSGKENVSHPCTALSAQQALFYMLTCMSSLDSHATWLPGIVPSDS